MPALRPGLRPVRPWRRRGRGQKAGRRLPRPAALVGKLARGLRRRFAPRRWRRARGASLRRPRPQADRPAGDNRRPQALRPAKETSMPLTRDEDIYELLANARTIAMVGASDRPDRPSHGVMKFLQSRGYRVIPVNPQITGQHLHGEFVWRELAQIGEPIDIVDIFRRPMAAGEAVDEAIAVGAKAVWMQIGVINEEAAARAEAAGLKVVMDRCPKIEIPRLGVPKISSPAVAREGDRA